MRTCMLLIVVAGLSWWYVDYSYRITETQVRELYTTQQDAIQQFDAERQCAQMDDDFQGRLIIRQGGQSSEQQLDQKQACRLITLSTNLAQRMANRTSGHAAPSADIEIESIELSPNRKRATVQSMTTVRVGEMTVSRDRSTDTLIRRQGRLRVLSSESNTWAYAPQ